jgi:uncharacterized protein (TIGR00369 family)
MGEERAAGDPTALVRGWLEHSPFASNLGIRVEELGEGQAELTLPYDEKLTTVGDIVHGGAISSLIDAAAAAAAVSAATGDTFTGGATIDLSVSLLTAARGSDLRARARVIRGGRAITFVEVDVEDGDGTPVAKGLVTYRVFSNG